MIFAPHLRHEAVGRYFDMQNKPTTLKTVVTVLAIVWYILEILTKVVQLLR